MQNNESNRDGSVTTGVEQSANLPQLEVDLEKQDSNRIPVQEEDSRDGALVSGSSTVGENPTLITIVVSSGDAVVSQVASTKEEIGSVVSPKKVTLSRTTSSQEQCRCHRCARTWNCN